MARVVEVNGLTKTFGRQTVLDEVSFHIDGNKIYGLLGRNGAGKTTLLKIIAAQQFATGGTVRLFGEAPYENDRVLSQTCLIQEGQRYPDTYTLADVLAVASALYPNWDAAYARELADAFGLPRRRQMIAKYSRGMRAAIGIVIGLASRAPLTMFDEPYLGLDAAARTLFYEQLLADYGENPRTVILSTHLIDEISPMLEHVLILDRGRLLVDEDAESLRHHALTVVGPAETVAAFAAGAPVLHREQLGDTVAACLPGPWNERRRREATELGLQVVPISLQQLFVYLTGASRAAGIGKAG